MSQNDTQIYEAGNLTIKGASLITMAKNATKPTSRNSTRKARVNSSTMSQIIKEAKSMIFDHGVINTTAKAQTSKLMQPKEQILIRSSSKNFNHLHAVKTVIYQPQ